MRSCARALAGVALCVAWLGLSGAARANVLVEWAAHTDDHILSDHAAFARELENEPRFEIGHDVFSAPIAAADSLGGFEAALQAALAKLATQHGSSELFLVTSSHATTSTVSLWNGWRVMLPTVATRILSHVAEYESKHGPIRINIVFDACHSNALHAHLDAAKTHLAIKSSVSLLASAPSANESYSLVPPVHIIDAELRV